MLTDFKNNFALRYNVVKKIMNIIIKLLDYENCFNLAASKLMNIYCSSEIIIYNFNYSLDAL